MSSTVQRHQSPERLILCQISSLIYPKIQRRQVITNVLHPNYARPPRWSTPVLWRRFENSLASICVLIHSCKMLKENETTGLNDGRKWWLVGNARHRMLFWQSPSPQQIYGSLGSPKSILQNDTWISSAVFVNNFVVNNRHTDTDHATTSAAISHNTQPQFHALYIIQPNNTHQ